MEKSTCTVLRGGGDGNIASLTRPLRRGRTYGTVLVDLNRHKVLDLLPDRKAETAKTWIPAHPEIDLVSRDRGGDYAAAARAGAPQAVQTADRFHLVKNVAEAVQKALARCGTQMRKDRKEGHGNDRRPLIRGVSPIPCDF